MEHSQLNVNDTSTLSISSTEEKTVFERAIIEAFKEKSSKDIIDKLLIALDEIKFVVKDIRDVNKSIIQGSNSNANSTNITLITEKDSINVNTTHTTTTITNNSNNNPISYSPSNKYLLNNNILDKLRRLIERKLFNVNITIARIFDNLLDSNNFDILSKDPLLLVNFSNEILNLIESIKSSKITFQLERRSSAFLNFLNQNKSLNDEQRAIITELVDNFPGRDNSETYKKFDATKDSIIILCRSSNLEQKIEGINLLMEAFGQMSSLEEQFDILMEKVPSIVKAVIHQPNPDFKDAYFQIGHFLCSLLFATRFKIDANMMKYKVNLKELYLNYLFIVKDDILLDEHSKGALNFLHDYKYELTAQKDLLSRCENIFKLCILVINTLSIYENIFDLQFVCYIILKRIYFSFPQFRPQIEDQLSVILTNMCLFTGKFERDNSEECRIFLHYLINCNDSNSNEVDAELKKKIKNRINAKNCDTELTMPRSKQESKYLFNYSYT